MSDAHGPAFACVLQMQIASFIIDLAMLCARLTVDSMFQLAQRVRCGNGSIGLQTCSTIVVNLRVSLDGETCTTDHKLTEID